MSAPARRELVRHMIGCGLSERRSLRMIGMSASAYRYQPATVAYRNVTNCAMKRILAVAWP